VEEERKKRREKSKSGAEQVKEHNKNVLDGDKNEKISPSPITNNKEYQEKYKKEKLKKLKEISKNSKKLSPKTKNKFNSEIMDYRIGEKETKDFFRKKDQYLGHCQICGFTFKTNNGINYFERFTWTDYKKIKIKANLVDPGNSLCLCAKCHSIIKSGGDFNANFLTDKIFEKLENNYNFDSFVEDVNNDDITSIPECFEEHKEFDDHQLDKFYYKHHIQYKFRNLFRVYL
jgi:hypothetical protein